TILPFVLTDAPRGLSASLPTIVAGTSHQGEVTVAYEGPRLALTYQGPSFPPFPTDSAVYGVLVVDDSTQRAQGVLIYESVRPPRPGARPRAHRRRRRGSRALPHPAAPQARRNRRRTGRSRAGPDRGCPCPAAPDPGDLPGDPDPERRARGDAVPGPGERTLERDRSRRRPRPPRPAGRGRLPAARLPLNSRDQREHPPPSGDPRPRAVALRHRLGPRRRDRGRRALRRRALDARGAVAS